MSDGSTGAGATVTLVHWDWLLKVTGIDDPSGHFANFWGGIGADIGEFAIFAVLLRKIKCHANGCWRVGLHRVEGTPYVTCRKHHPQLPGSKSVTAEDIAAAHAAAQGGADPA